MARLPDGIAVVGDAVFHANPEHAQGMTFCMLAAETLGAMVAESGQALPAQTASRSSFSAAWPTGTARTGCGTPRRVHLPGIIDDSGLGRLERYQVELYRRVRSLAPRDGALLCAAMKVTQVERMPSSLLQPSILWRLAHRAVRG